MGKARSRGQERTAPTWRHGPSPALHNKGEAEEGKPEHTPECESFQAGQHL